MGYLSKLKKCLPHPLTLLSGVLIVFAFPHWDLSPLIWFALTPWLVALRSCKSYRQAVAQGIWLSVLMTSGGYYWTAYSMHLFGGLNWFLAIGGLLALGLVNQPQFTLFAPIFVWICRHVLNECERENSGSTFKAVGIVFGSAALYTGIDANIFKLFLDTFGYSQHNAPWIRQSADLGGPFLITFIIIVHNLGLFWLIERVLRRSEPSLGPSLRRHIPVYAIFLGFVLCFTLYGFIRQAQIERLIDNPIKMVRASVIQSNIGGLEKLKGRKGIRDAADKAVDKYLRMSESAIKESPDFIVWPETAYPTIFRTPFSASAHNRDQLLEDFVRSTGVPLLFGGYDRDRKLRKKYNSLFILSPEVDPEQRSDLRVYHKNILLPFGEYIPGVDGTGLAKELFPQMGFFGRGPGPQVYEIKTDQKSFKVAPIICYEALYPYYTIESARMQNDIILNITNDSWFGPYGEPYLHFALTVFRGIETRLPQIRATNTGITALILPDGRVLDATAPMTERLVTMSVPVVKRTATLMVVVGDWFPLAILLVALGYGAFLYRNRPSSHPRRRQKRRRKKSKA